MKQKVNFFWFRRDLRLSDNAGLYHALQGDRPLVPLFIFDTDILDYLPRRDARVEFIHRALGVLSAGLRAVGSDLVVRVGKPAEVWEQLLEAYEIGTVYTNRDYEPYAIRRDDAIAKLLAQKGVGFKTYKDHVVFEKDEVLKDDGQPYVVFTPYSAKWRARLQSRLESDGVSFYLNLIRSKSTSRTCGGRPRSPCPRLPIWVSSRRVSRSLRPK